MCRKNYNVKWYMFEMIQIFCRIYLTIYPREPYNYLLYEYCVEKDGMSQTDLVETKLMG